MFVGKYTEAGFTEDLVPDLNSDLFRGADIPHLVFHWHNDSFELPPGSERLAKSALYENQAFCCGSIVGIQFHLEVDLPMAGAWGMHMRKDLKDIELLGTLRRNMELFYRNFKAKYNI